MEFGVTDIKPGILRRMPWNTREPVKLKDPATQSLMQSVKAAGIKIPLIVRPDPKHKGQYEIACGERRWTVAKALEMPLVPCLVRDLSDDQLKEIVLIENTQREGLTAFEEAKGVHNLSNSGMKLADVAAVLGQSKEWVARRAKLTALSTEWRKTLAEGFQVLSDWPASMLEMVARFDPAIQDQMLAEMKAQPWNIPDDPASLRGAQAQWVRSVGMMPWDVASVELVPGAGACTVCPKRSDKEATLFDTKDLDVWSSEALKPKDGFCLDAVCWTSKLKKFMQVRVADVLVKNPELRIMDPYNVLGSGALGDAESFKAPILPNDQSSWRYENCKKSDSGSFQVLHMSGPKLGKLEWVVDSQARRRQKAGGPEATPPRRTGDPTPLSVRRERLEKRRQSAMIDEMLAQLKPKECTAAEDDILRLTQVLGTPICNTETADGMGHSQSDAWKSWPSLKKKTHVQLIGMLNDDVKHVIERRCVRAQGQGSVLAIQVKQLCELFSIDFETLRQNAVDKFPEPKSWKNLNEDGSQKPAETKPEKPAKKPPAKRIPKDRQATILETSGRLIDEDPEPNEQGVYDAAYALRIHGKGPGVEVYIDAVLLGAPGYAVGSGWEYKSPIAASSDPISEKFPLHPDFNTAMVKMAEYIKKHNTDQIVGGGQKRKKESAWLRLWCDTVIQCYGAK